MARRAGINRREFVRGAAASAAWAGAWAFGAEGFGGAGPRPNILWITCEDTSPRFGFCGDAYAVTPHLDRLATESVHYRHAFATAPVCSPARFCLISGLYAHAFGTQRLRSRFPVPDWVCGLPSFLRAAGYYCTNNVKTDYNTAAEPRLVRESWDVCSGKAHWRGRAPGQPFFAVFNLTQTHQGPTNVLPQEQFERTIASTLTSQERHDPARAAVPPYYPDTPSVRRIMARVYDCITAMDRRAGTILTELAEDSLADDTLVFFYPDHGQGIPRGKRTLYDSGLRVPLLIRFPPRLRHLAPAGPGSSCDRLVSFVDFGATVLSLADVPLPAHLQGTAFLGHAAGPERQWVYGARDRVDEAIDLSRSVRDQRYLYIRNYMPHLSWNAPEGYSDRSELRREITRLAQENRLDAAQLTYAGRTKAPEMLFDSLADPHQIQNLAEGPAARPVLERRRGALREWLLGIRDLGFMPEWRAAQLCAGGRPLREAADAEAYPFERVFETAEWVGRPDTTSKLASRLADADCSVRYWAAIGLRAAGAAAAAHGEALRQALEDPCPPVRIEAAGVLADRGDAAALKVLSAAVVSSDPQEAVHAARTLQLLGPMARNALPAMKEALDRSKGGRAEGSMYIRFALEPAIAALEGRQ
ncbi:MAG: sulfatase-like hydrolase/transferase [Lentisphaeria bacterium]|nr:sulfatase-like hydrolase/transferase [Lentisphaeria bacterium]